MKRILGRGTLARVLFLYKVNNDDPFSGVSEAKTYQTLHSGDFLLHKNQVYRSSEFEGSYGFSVYRTAEDHRANDRNRTVCPPELFYQDLDDAIARITIFDVARDKKDPAVLKTFFDPQSPIISDHDNEIARMAAEIYGQNESPKALYAFIRNLKPEPEHFHADHPAFAGFHTPERFDILLSLLNERTTSEEDRYLALSLCAYNHSTIHHAFDSLYPQNQRETPRKAYKHKILKTAVRFLTEAESRRVNSIAARVAVLYHPDQAYTTYAIHQEETLMAQTPQIPASDPVMRKIRNLINRTNHPELRDDLCSVYLRPSVRAEEGLADLKADGIEPSNVTIDRLKTYSVKSPPGIPRLVLENEKTGRRYVVQRRWQRDAETKPSTRDAECLMGLNLNHLFRGRLGEGEYSIYVEADMKRFERVDLWRS
ncbi:MAG: hypothetical protein AAF492_21970, partial [Verrucomicrobiota bacterium]